MWPSQDRFESGSPPSLPRCTARSSSGPGCRPFKPGDAGSNPVRASRPVLRTVLRSTGKGPQTRAFLVAGNGLNRGRGEALLHTEPKIAVFMRDWRSAQAGDTSSRKPDGTGAGELYGRP